MNNKIYMSDLHFDHKTWDNQLQYQKQEIDYYTERLEEIVRRWTDHEVLQKVEHFQNAFRIQRNHIDELLHDIHVHEDDLIQEAKDNPVAIDHVHFEDHKTQRESIEMQWKLYNELKTEYLDFLRKVM